MQTFIDQRLVENVAVKKSVMSKFVNLLNKLCIFPITVKNKIQFSFIKFTIYLVWAVTPTLLYYYFLMRSKVYVDFVKQSSLLKASSIVVFANTFVLMLFFPLLAQASCKMNADIVLAANHQWPKHGSKILFSLVAMLAGYSSQIYFQGVQFAPLPVSLIMFFSLACLFTVPNLVILIFLQRILP